VSVGALELGGSHVSTCVVDVETWRVANACRLPFDPNDARPELLGAIRHAAGALTGVTRVGFAAPGPFDYENGICMVRGLGKLEGLFGVDLAAALAPVLQLDRAWIRFLNDAEAFLLGESVAGAARGHDRVVGLTLGTGLGSAFLADGEIVRSGEGVSPNGDLHVVPFRGAPVEDAISGRAISARFDGRTGAAEIAARAGAGDPGAVAAFASFGADLAEFLDPWVRAFRPTRVVVGGSIARAWRHFGAALPPIATVAERLDDAALLGAAAYAVR
jgi:predicted NBD/HSP70 family sugar kinase